MKRIWWLIQQLDAIGGTEMVSTQIMNGLCDEYEINLVCLGEKPEKINYQIDERIKIHYINIDKLYLKCDEQLSNMINKKRYLKFIISIIKIAYFWAFKRFHFRKKIKELTSHDDLIIASSLDNYAVSPRGRKVFFHYHFNAKFFFALSSRLGLLICRKPDKWIFITNTTKEQVTKKVVGLKDKVHAIHNPTRYERYLDTTYKNNNLIFIGRYAPQKRPLLAIEMAKILKTMTNDFTLNFYGDGPLKQKMIDLVNDYQLNDNVIINSSNPNILDEIRKSDLLVMTSEYEGFGLVILEANSQSVPCITLYWGDATQEIVSNGKNGYIIMNDDINKQAQTIFELLTNKEELITLKTNSYHYADLFTKETIIKEWKELLNRE